MDEQRRYGEEPDPARYPGPGSYDLGPYQRPEGAYRLPDDELRRSSTDPGGALSFGVAPEPPDDVPISPSRSALDAIRVPLRPTEYPAPRPGVAADPGPATTGGASQIPPARDPAGFGPPAPAAIRPDAGRPDGMRPDTTYSDTTYSDGMRADTLRPDTLRPDATYSDGTRPDQMRTEPIRADAARRDPGRIGSSARHDVSAFAPLGAAAPDAPDTDRHQADRVGSRRGDTVYRTRRPVSAVVFTLVTALLLVPAVRLLVDAGFAAEPGARGIVPAVLLTLGLPLTGAGLYGVAGAGGVVDRQVFLRAPAGYLPVGLILLVAAGLAVA